MKIATIGAGAIGGALVEGLLKCKSVNPADITISDPSVAIQTHFINTGVNITSDNSAAIKEAEVVVVAVKPWLVETVIKGILDTLDYERQILVVIAAGVSSDDIRSWLDKGDFRQPHLFLCIPNTAIAIRESMTFLVPVNAVSTDTNTIVKLFNQLGQTIVIEENQLAAGTTLASCGIAYAMRYVRASTEGGVEIGFRAADARKIVLQTVKGAVSLLQSTGNHPEAEIDKVTTAGGVTIKGLNEMEHAGFTSAVIRGLKAGLKH